MDIRDRIAKVLALAESPNENEAKAALLKARELMAKYKLRPEEVGRTDAKGKKVIKRLTKVSCTKMTDPWTVQLSAIIAENYCCKAYRCRGRGKKTVYIGFVGLEDDFSVCEKIFLYAVDCVRSQTAMLIAGLSMSGSRRREMKNSFGFGFCRGLKAAFAKQQQEHQEWGLVLQTPSEVVNAFSEMGKPSPYTKETVASPAMLQAGFAAGFEFDPRGRLNGVVDT